MSMIRSLSHILLSAIFISGGASAFLNPGGRVKKVAEGGVAQPKQAVELNGAAMLLGGVLLGLGLAPKLAAMILLATLIPTTIVGHPFWKEETPAARQNQQIQFLKNLGLIGGLLVVLLEDD